METAEGHARPSVVVRQAVEKVAGICLAAVIREHHTIFDWQEPFISKGASVREMNRGRGLYRNVISYFGGLLVLLSLLLIFSRLRKGRGGKLPTSALFSEDSFRTRVNYDASFLGYSSQSISFSLTTSRARPFGV